MIIIIIIIIIINYTPYTIKIDPDAHLGIGLLQAVRGPSLPRSRSLSLCLYRERARERESESEGENPPSLLSPQVSAPGHWGPVENAPRGVRVLPLTNKLQIIVNNKQWKLIL